MSWLRQRIGALTLGVAILALVTLLCFVAAIFFGIRFVEDTVGLVSHNLASRSGLSLYLVEGLVIFATIPFFWAIVMFTKNVWGLFKLGWNFLALYKNKYGPIIVAYVGLYFLVVHGASLQAYQYKSCAEMPEGISTADSPGKDPACGRAQTPAPSPPQLKPPREITIVDAENYEWFDRVTGQPRVWYSVVKENSYRFFDNHGVDPHNRHELKPVTPEIADQLKQQQAAAAVAQRDSDKKLADANARKLAGVQRAQKDSEMASLVQRAEFSFESKDYKSTIDTCTQVLATSPQNQTCMTLKQHASMKLADQLVTKGLAQWEKGDFDDATLSADQALALDRGNQNAIKLKKLSNQLKARVNQ